MTTTAAIYVRISKDQTGEEAGVSRQIKDCKDLAAKQGWTVGEIFTESDTSAFKRKRNAAGVLRVVRPEFARMLQGFADQEFNAMVAYNIDRVARDPRDLEDLIDAVDDNGVQVKSVGSEMDLSTIGGITTARFMVTIANQESKATSRRVVRAKLDHAMAGKFIGGSRRFGYNADCSELIEEEAAAIRDAYDRIIAGESVNAITRHWAAQGIVGSFGSPFSVASVLQILRRPLNGGFATYKGEIVGKSILPTIITEETFKKAMSIMDSNSRKPLIGRPPQALLSSFLHCKTCETKMRRMDRKRQERPNHYVYYTCETRCRGIRQEILDAYIGKAFLVWATDPKIAAKIKQPAKFSKSTPVHEIEAAKWRKKIADLEDLFSAGDLDAVDYAKGTKAAREKVAELEKLTLKAAGKPNLAALLQSSDKEAAWKSKSDAEKREILAECIEKITVGPSNKAKRDPHDMTMVDISWLEL